MDVKKLGKDNFAAHAQVPTTEKTILNAKEKNLPQSDNSDSVLSEDDLVEVVEPIMTKKYYSLLGKEELSKTDAGNLPKQELIGESEGKSEEKQ